MISDTKKIDFREDLGLFQKVLLDTDGTVTNLVSLYLNEKVVAKKLSNLLQYGEFPEFPTKRPQERILFRSVLLGTSDGKNHVYAESNFIFDRFSLFIQQRLMDTDLPVGLLWREEKFEMYREVVEQGVETSPTIAGHLGVDPTTPLLSRTYLIHHHDSVIGKITEKFAATSFL